MQTKYTSLCPPGDVLDVGAAAGFILKGFENKGWKGTGLEPNETMSEYGRKAGMNMKTATLETAEFRQKFDLVLLIQVIAHLYDLKSAIERVKNFLNIGGHVFIETWNKDSFTAKIFGKNWHEYSPPGTLNYFSKATLQKFMDKNNFKLIKTGRPKKSISSSHARSLIRHKLTESKGLKWLAPVASWIPRNMILPYPSEDLFWALYKKN